MNRREAMQTIGYGVNPLGLAALTPPQPNTVEYAICKQRGHVATQFGNSTTYSVPAVFISIPDGPVNTSGTSAGSWQTCWYCKKQYRYVTTMEER